MNASIKEAQDLSAILERAAVLHSQGYNCSETVVICLSERWGIEPRIAAATGFGSGMVRTQDTCGSLAGAILALGESVGRIKPDDRQAIGRVYKRGKGIVEHFRETMGTTICKEILASEATLGLRRGTKCEEAIATAIRAAIETEDA